MKRKIDFEGATKTLQGEEWKDVTGYEGIYKVSNLGRVKRLKRRFDDGRKSIMRERILLASKDKDGCTPLTSIPITWTTKEKRVYQYTKTGECVGIYESCTEAAKSVNGSASNICGCCLGYYKTSKGYIWSYNNDN